MAFFNVVKWSPVEIEYLTKHLTDPVMQLCIALAKSRNAVNSKIIEIKTGVAPTKSGRKNNRSKIGKREDCNDMFFRSGWEANLYRFLCTDKSIQQIEYESTDFTFWQFGIKKGTVSYTPDFKITYKTGEIIYIEVKGNFLKTTDKVKIRRFKKYYPSEFSKLTAVISSPTSKTAAFFSELSIPVKWYYNNLNKEYKNSIPHWE